jgi:hypothetical protein
MVNVSKSLLDIESSLANQYEFMALTGKEVNFDLARQLALQGDIAGATKLILDQMGGIDEFNQMDVLQKEAAAKAAGMSVDELSKSLAIQDALGNATEDQLAAAQGLGLSAAEIQSMNKEDLKARLAQEQSAKDLASDVANLGNELKMMVLPVGQAVLSVLQAMSPVLKLIGGAIKIAFLPIEYAAIAFEKLVNFAKEFSYITAGILTFTTLIVAKKKEEAILSAANNTHEFISEGFAKGKLFLQKGLNKEKIKEGVLGAKNMVKAAAEGAMVLGKAIASLFGTFAQIPFGIGIPLAIAAAGGLFALFKKATSVGDMGIDPNGGPIVTSPNLGGIFQGKKQDGLSMGPNMGTNPSASGTTNTGGSTDMSTTNALLNQLVSNISALSNRPVQIKIGDRVVDEIKAQADINSTYVVG